MTSDTPGLSSQEAEKLLKQYGPNDIPARADDKLKKFFAPLYSPISLMLLGAAGLSYLSGKLFDFWFILGLYFINFSIQKWQEFKADKAIEELQKKLSFDVSTLRDGKWMKVDAKGLVPGDVVRLGLGSLIPVDAKVVSASNLSLNEAALTGESLPQEKASGDKLLSGSYILTGSAEAEVTATGAKTAFGKTVFAIERDSRKSLLEKDILSISKFLMAISFIAVAILTIYFWLNGSLTDLLILDLSLVIAGVPIALPAVMAIILSIGAAGLAKKKVVIRRLSALEDLANVNLLLTDKTGTLTMNRIRVAKIVPFGNSSEQEVCELAYYASSQETPDAIDKAIQSYLETLGAKADGRVSSFTPYDSERKRTTATVEKDGGKFIVSIGAPQVILSLSKSDQASRKEFEDEISKGAQDGYRVIAVAVKDNELDEKNMRLVGIMLMSDPLEAGSEDTLRFMRANGIEVKLVTGDDKAITERISSELGLQGPVLDIDETREAYDEPEKLYKAAAFSEVLPEDKAELVKLFDKKYVVASTGDGINDLPALSAASVGLAVAGAVSALKSLADIVLLGRGISVIKDAIIESRKVFVRLYNYSVYRISESFRLIITILILGLWYGFYPLLPTQLILLAFFNDIPIVSLAVDRVKIARKPSVINARKRMTLGVLYGAVGVLNSMVLFLIMINFLHLPLVMIQTIFFLKLTVSGHALIFVAHTRERWWRFLPAKAVMLATFSTQILATILAVTGFLMPSKISLPVAAFVWLWAIFWMQVSDLVKDFTPSSKPAFHGIVSSLSQSEQ